MRRMSATGSVGFTLIELMVVLAILTLMAAAIPLALSSHAIEGRRVAAGTRQLIAALRDAQSLSIQKGVPLQVLPKDSSIKLLLPSGGDSPPQEVESFDLRVPVQQTPGAGGTALPLILYPDGSTSGGRFRVGYEERSSIVSVSAITGRVRSEAGS